MNFEIKNISSSNNYFVDLHSKNWEKSLIYRIVYVALSIFTAGIFPIVHLYILPLFSRKVNLLEQMYPLVETEKMVTTLKKIDELIGKNEIVFPIASSNHALHDYVTDVTLEARNEPRMKKIWSEFLQKMDGKTCQYPDGTFETLDFAPEKSYLEDCAKHPSQINIDVERLNRHTDYFEKDIIDICRVDHESFGTKEGPVLTRPYIVTLLKREDITFLVARDQSKKIHGILIACDESKPSDLKQHIWSLGRRANAAKCGIANRLLQNFISHYVPKNHKVILEVREQNEIARKLYEKFNFINLGRKTLNLNDPNDFWFYQSPFDHALRMVREA